MSIERLYTRRISSVRRSATLQEAALLMREHHVGCLLVTTEEPESGDVVGIVTDRDLVIQAMAEGTMPDELAVRDVMTPELVTIPEHASVHKALEIMRMGGVRRLGVTNKKDTIVGILSLDDIMDGMAADLSSLAGVLRSERERECATTAVETKDVRAPDVRIA